ncbi:MAG: non-canonical purine NTP pyrophosphatase, partial [Pseudomonadota bacterium]
DYLNGAPGIYSARYSTLEGSKDYGAATKDENNNLKLLDELKDVDDEALRTARYQCILVYMRHAADPVPIICQAAWEGVIMHEEVGDNGFGYDPLFWVPEHGMSSAQLNPDVKNGMSHRGKALRLLHAVVWLSGHYHVGLGRFDQYMWPYLKRDLESGIETMASAEVLLTEFYFASAPG